MPVTGHKNTRRGGQQGTEYHNETPRQRQDSSTSWPLEHWFRFSLAWSKDFFPFASGNSNPEPDPGRHRERRRRNSKGARADRLCKSNRKAINTSSRSGQSFQVSLTVNTVNTGGLLSFFTARNKRQLPETAPKRNRGGFIAALPGGERVAGCFCANCTGRNQQRADHGRM